jgi:glycosyltransferase involved in cell wall biosynthesis
MSKKIALLIPAYNEELTISDTITAFHNVRKDIDIWVIDNCSTDNTNQIAQNTIKKLGIKGGVLYEAKKGKANAVREGFQQVDADIYLMVDGDNTYPACHLDMLIEKIENGYDMVIGDRISNGSYQKVINRRFHEFGNSLVLRLVNKFFDGNLSDILSGYRGFSKRFVTSYPMLVSGFEIETDITLFALYHRLKVCEIPIGYNARPDGSFSKLNTISDGAKVVFTFFQIIRYYRPLYWFSSVGLLFALLGLIAAYPVINEWIATRYISHIPLAILATGFELVAFIFFCIGLILDSISYHQRQLIALVLKRKC